MEKVSFHNVYNTLSPVAMTMEQLLSPNRLWDPKNKQAGRNHDGAVCREGCAGAGRLRGGEESNANDQTLHPKRAVLRFSLRLLQKQSS